jgi:hypothetical protein
MQAKCDICGQKVNMANKKLCKPCASIIGKGKSNRKTMGKEIRTRYRIQDEVKVLEVVHDVSSDQVCYGTRWAVGLTGLLRWVLFDQLGPIFGVECYDKKRDFIKTVSCRRVRLVKRFKREDFTPVEIKGKPASETLIEDRR